jgi:hypothetical protein
VTDLDEQLRAEVREDADAYSELRDLLESVDCPQVNTDDHLRMVIGDAPGKSKVVFEHLNRIAMEELASSVAAKTFRIVDGGPTLLCVLGDFLAQCTHGCTRDGATPIRVRWREEESMYLLGRHGRRYSGRDLDGESEDVAVERFLSTGISKTFIQVSSFALPGWLRDVCRSGLRNRYVLDLVNAHPYIVSKRHPDLVHLREYVDNRDAILVQTHSDRKIAKQLYLRLLYGGSANAWSRSHGHAPVPPFAALYARDLNEARKRDVAAIPEDEMVKIRELSARVEDFVQYVLNTAEERDIVDNIGTLVTRAGGSILAYEHDGLYIHFEGNCAELKEQITAALMVPVTIVPVKSVEDAMKRAHDEIVTRSPALASIVGVRDNQWQLHYELIRCARIEKLSSHGLFAAVVLRSPMVSSEIPYPVRDLIKLAPTAERFTWYNPRLQCWSQGGTAGEEALKAFISYICRRDLSSYTLVRQSDGGLDVHGAGGRWDVTNEGFKTGVARAMRSELIVSEDFHLDPTETLKYLNFDGDVFDCTTMTWRPMSPDLLISRNTGWTYTTPPWWGTPAMEALERALAAVRRREDERGLGQPSDYDDELIALLEVAAAGVPELAFWHVFTRDCWESTIFELKHMVKSVFGLRMASALWTRGPGRNGKDTVCNIMTKMLGTYACTIAAEALTHVRDPNAPSPVFALCRARRFVAIREVDTAVQFQLQVYKRFTDPLSMLSGRDLYEKLVHYNPQYLAFFASNNPPPMTADLAVRERTSIVEHVCVSSATRWLRLMTPSGWMLSRL